MGFFNLVFNSGWRVNVDTRLRHTVLYPGNFVEGYVEIRSPSPVEFHAIRLKICGKEKVRCVRERRETMHGGGINDENDNHAGMRETIRDEFFETNLVYKQLITLCGNMKCFGMRNTQTLPPGTYYYPFCFQLPPGLPPSFTKRVSDDSADILYYVKAYVDIPFGRDAVHKTYFTVLQPVPQRQWVDRNPASVGRNWHVTLCCCIDKGDVKARIFMDRTVISLDRDNLVVCADIDNSLGKEPVKSLEVSLINNLSYTARHLTERNRLVVAKQSVYPGVDAGQKGRVRGVILLPRNIVPTVNTFNITSEYLVQIELNIPMASDPSHSFPVIIAQSVDESNWSPPVQFGQCYYNRWSAANNPELYYQPPSHPVFNYQPPPLPPPSNVPMWQCPAATAGVHMPLPGVTWQEQAQPTAYKVQRHPNAIPQGDVHWNVTVQSEQFETPPMRCEERCGVTAYGGGDNNNDGHEMRAIGPAAGENSEDMEARV